MTKREGNSGVIITGSTVTGVVAGANARIHASVAGGGNELVLAQIALLSDAVAKAGGNAAQVALLREEVEEIKARALAADRPGFERKVKRLDTLLQSFGGGLKGLSEGVSAIKAIAVGLGCSLPFLG